MTIVAAVCSVGAVICYLLCYFMVTERVKVETKTEKFSLKNLFSMLAHNKALIGIVVSALLLLLATLSLGNMNAYIYPNYFGNVKAMSTATLITTAVTLCIAPFTVKLAEIFGKKELAIIGSLISAGALIVAFIIHTTNVWVWVGLYAVVYVGNALFNLVVWAMITDVIDDTEVKTGERSDGTIYSVYSFARKLGQAASSGITGILLSIVGYTSATAFDEKVVNGIYNITCLVPAIAFVLLALSMFFLYPLSKKVVIENSRILREKREGK